MGTTVFQKSFAAWSGMRSASGSAAGILANECHRCVARSGVAPNIPPSPTIVFPNSPLARLIPREDAVKAYSAWHHAQVCTKEQKKHYDAALELTLSRCYDLNMLTMNKPKMYRFFTKSGIPAGVACRFFFCDVEAFLDDPERGWSA